MSQWYLSYAGNSRGPFDRAQAAAQVRKNSSGYAWREGSILGALGGLLDGDDR